MDGYLDNYISNYAAIAAPLYQLTRKDGRKRKKTHSGRYKTPSQRTRQWHSLTFFDPSRPIIPRTEASYNQGLSAAQLQKTDKGIQPAHFISPTMAETEKRYNQTEKDALAIKWAKEQLRVYRLGAPRFRIVATHKPLLPLFNKAKATMSPRKNG